MKGRVLRRFKDKTANLKVVEVGETIEGPAARIRELESKGFVEVIEIKKRKK